MPKRHLIAITARTFFRKIPGEPLVGIKPEYMVGQNYSEAVYNSGGAPVFLPSIADKSYCEKIISSVAGILISGGDDMDPALYGEEPHTNLGLVDVQKGDFEFMLTKMALRRQIPILGICGGIQMLNVAAGGTLYQDIPSQTGSQIKHSQQTTKSEPSHFITVEKSTRLHKIIGRAKLRVNSTHHQAVRKLAKGFIISARAADGIIEAIELPGRRFVVGVQWHPESLASHNPVFRAIFDSFIRECAR
jgi:putative glutamine amidotransferase